MQIQLSADDVHELRLLLDDYLPQLRMEVARTEARAFRHEMLKRQDVCERLLRLLTETDVERREPREPREPHDRGTQAQPV